MAKNAATAAWLVEGAPLRRSARRSRSRLARATHSASVIGGLTNPNNSVIVLPKSVFSHGCARPLGQLHLLDLGPHLVPLLVNGGRGGGKLFDGHRGDAGPGGGLDLLDGFELADLALDGFGHQFLHFRRRRAREHRDQHGGSLRNGRVLLLAELACRPCRPTPAPQSAPANSPPGARHKTGPARRIQLYFQLVLTSECISFHGLLRGHTVCSDFDGSAVIQKTRSRGHHLFARPQPFGNENRTVENVAGLHRARLRLCHPGPQRPPTALGRFRPNCHREPGSPAPRAERRPCPVSPPAVSPT